MPRTFYDQELTNTPEWKTLYARYTSGSSNKYKELFPAFQEFFDWSMEHGFGLGAKLIQLDPEKPYEKDNLQWIVPEKKPQALWGEENKESIKKWNETVNRIRVHYGLEPFELEGES